VGAFERLLTWRGLDTPRMELAEVKRGEAGLVARGVQIATAGVAPEGPQGEAVDVPGRFRLDYELVTDPELVTVSITVRARAEGDSRELQLRRAAGGEWSADGQSLPDLHDALDCDLGLSPLTNFMPVHRAGLAAGGEGADFVMAWITVPDLRVHRSEQRYEPGGPRRVRYVGRSEAFTSELELAEDGFVDVYPGLAERV
jgi:hypothetical protein